MGTKSAEKASGTRELSLFDFLCVHAVGPKVIKQRTSPLLGGKGPLLSAAQMCSVRRQNTL